MDRSTWKLRSTAGGELLRQWCMLFLISCAFLTCSGDVPPPKKTADDFPPDTPKALVVGNLPESQCNAKLGGVISALEEHIIVETSTSQEDIVSKIRNDAQGENRIAIVIIVADGKTSTDGGSRFLGPWLPSATPGDDYLSEEEVRSAVFGNPADPNNKVHAPFKAVVILACNSGNDPGSWRQAFNAEYYIGLQGQGGSMLEWVDGNPVTTNSREMIRHILETMKPGVMEFYSERLRFLRTADTITLVNPDVRDGKLGPFLFKYIIRNYQTYGGTESGHIEANLVIDPEVN